MERQEKMRNNTLHNRSIYEAKTNKEINDTLEDMCIMGNIVKEEIIEEKKSNPEKFISIKEATKNENSDEFCLGLLAQNLENLGMETAITKETEKEEEKEAASTALQFLVNGMIEKKKYDMHFDLNEKRIDELLNDEEEQKKFNDNLKLKLSKEFGIPIEKIIITYPTRGSYAVQVIFQTDEFNSLNVNQIKQKFKDEPELGKLKVVHEKLVMEGCKLSKNMLDSRGNRESGWGENEKRGGYDYIPPKGWKGYGLKVIGKYDGGNDDWLAYDNNPREWAIAYHGIGRDSNDVEGITNKIYTGSFKAGSNQAYENYDDMNHPGQKVGVGVYCSPKPEVMEKYSGTSTTVVNGKKYKMGFMMRVKPDKIRTSKSKPDYWVLNGTTDEMRPYRLMLKEL